MKCTVTNCDKPLMAKGMCSKHYYRVKRGGTPELSVKQKAALRKCDIPECGKPHESLGLCAMHLQRKRRNGDPNNPGKNLFDGKAKERNLARTAKWKKVNRVEYNVYLANKKARIKEATPSWVDFAELKEIYRNRENAEVDHIIPILHPDVCGLHVPWNLQYLSPLDNNRKNNSFDGTYENTSWQRKGVK